MIYSYKCQGCGAKRSFNRSMQQGPIPSPDHPISAEKFSDDVYCAKCDVYFTRDWQADAPMIDTSGCRDHSEVKESARVRSGWDGGKSPERVEHEFKRHIEQRRSQIRDAGGQRGSIKHKFSVPAHLYHGKIKETGDKNYWSDPKNLNRHKECKVDD